MLTMTGSRIDQVKRKPCRIAASTPEVDHGLSAISETVPTEFRSSFIRKKLLEQLPYSFWMQSSSFCIIFVCYATLKPVDTVLSENYPPVTHFSPNFGICPADLNVQFVDWRQDLNLEFRVQHGWQFLTAFLQATFFCCTKYFHPFAIASWFSGPGGKGRNKPRVNFSLPVAITDFYHLGK